VTARDRDRLRWFNELPPAAAARELVRCCGARAWAARVAAGRPYADMASLLAAADAAWAEADRASRLEAFAAHPRIGQSDGASAWSRREQAGARGAAPEVLAALAEGNRRYEARFGHVFLICASGRDAAEMLAELEARLGNDPETELRVAAEEQRKITRLRLERLLSE
jgi:2-oxo-4-hydroxy-4-carboxy-5-ureidoimidazoline decarboxylase